MKWLIDDLIKNRNIEIIITLLMTYFLLKILNVLITNIDNYAEEINKNVMKKYINRIIVEKCSKLDIAIYDDVDIYNEIQFINSNYHSISSMVAGAIEMVSSFFSCVIIAIIAFKRLKVYVLVMVVSCIPAAISKIKYTKLLYELSVKQLNDERKIDYFVSLITDKKYSQELKHYDLGKWILNKIEKTWSVLLNEKKGTLRKGLKTTSIMTFIPEVCYLCIMIIIVNRIINKSLTIGDFSLYLGLITQIWGEINRITYNIDMAVEENSKIYFLRKFIKREPLIENGTLDIEKINDISFENVYFKYPNAKNYTINNLNLTLHNGDNVALVGENGSGKSTIIKLLLRFYDVTSGSICINGINIKNYDIKRVREKMGLYFQNNTNYAFSIRDNIILSQRLRNDNMNIEKAINISGFQDVMLNKHILLDDKLTKMFYQNGVELSGGENQRLALARTIYSNSNWIIFDEPSSALDPKNEYKFFENIRNATKGNTIIYISHRLSNISKSEKIFLIEGGHVIESGELNDLISQKGKFYELFMYQKNMI